MAQQLTERQQQIKGLLEQGKPPPQIAKDLKITTNAVYQQIRRMRKGGTNVKSNGSRSGGARSGGRKSGGSARSSAQTPPRPAPVEQRAMTPLQAIRARRDEITAGVKQADAAVESAERELKRAKEAQEKVTARVADELKNLDAAEAAVKGEAPKAAAKPRPKRTAAKRSRSRSGGKARSGGSQASSQASSGGDGSGSAPAGSGQEGAPAPAAAPAPEGDGQGQGNSGQGEGVQQPEPATA